MQFSCWENPLEKGTATHSGYSGLTNSMDGGAWQATVQGVVKTEKLSLSFMFNRFPSFIFLHSIYHH